VAVAVALLAVTRSVPLTAATSVASVAVLRVVADRRRRQAAADGAEAAAELLSACAAELRGGAAPAAALAAAAAAGPAWAGDLCRPGLEPAAVLATLGTRPGCRALADLAVAWRVAESTGGALAGTAGRAAETARAELATRRTVAAELAGARATALLLAGLPVAGVLLGSTLGADPTGFLLGDLPGQLCLLAGVLLVAAGTAWTEAITRRAEPP
jgi:tight adherence protein B